MPPTVVNLITLTAGLVVAFGVAQPAEFHISPTGDDANPGSAERPFLTLPRARDAAREALAVAQPGDVAVVLHGGLYCLDEPLTLDERDSGTEGRPVVYRGAPGETARIVGGRLLTGWRAEQDGVHALDLPPDWRPNQLMENGRAGVLARTPNEGYLTVAATDGAAESPTLGWAEGELREAFSAEGAQVLAWAGYDEVWDGGKNYNWESSLLPVGQVDPAVRMMVLSGPTIRRLHAGNRYYVRGARAFLDAPGEFCVEAGVLYYRPRRLPIDEQEVLASTATRAFEIIGSSSTSPAHDIVLEGLTIELSQAPDAFGPSMYLACDGLVYVSRAQRITVRGCRLRNSGLAAVALDGESREHRVEGNLIEECAYSGVCLRGRWVGSAESRDVADAHVNHSHTIMSNYIRRCGRLIGQAAGVWLYESGENEISHNLIEEMPRYGIRIDGTAFGTLMRPREAGGLGGELFGQPITWENHLDFLHARGNRIINNEIRDCMRDSQDGGGITTYGTGAGNVIAGNLVHDFRSTVEEGAHAGIYLDDASNGFTVEGNIVARLRGSKYIYPLIIKGCDNIVRNNVLADNAAYSAIYVLETPHGGLPVEEGHPEEPTDRLRFSRNVLYRSGGFIYTIYPWRESIVAESDYNVIFPAEPPLRCVLDWKWAPWEQWTGAFGGRFEQHTLYEDPVFLDPEGRDYSLVADSPALTLGFEPIDLEAVGLRADFPFLDEVTQPDYEEG